MAQESHNVELGGGKDAIAFPLTRAQASVLFHTELTASTQDDLAGSGVLIQPRSRFTALIADNQTAGRGRVGRPWYSATGRSILISVLLALPASLRDQIGWLTLVGELPPALLLGDNSSRPLLRRRIRPRSPPRRLIPRAPAQLPDRAPR